MTYSDKFENSLQYLWIMRTLVPLGGHRRFVLENHYESDELALVLGLTDADNACIYQLSVLRDLDIHEQDSDFNRKVVMSNLRQLHKQAECRKGGLSQSSVMQSNLTKLSCLVKLNAIERQLLAFALTVQTSRPLNLALNLLGELSVSDSIFTLANILKLPGSDVRRALSPRGILARSGLLAMSTYGLNWLTGRLELLTAEFAERMTSCVEPPIELLRDTVATCTPAQLKISDYDHLGLSLQLLKRYLRQATKLSSPGVNVLIYGQPGTGKSELVRVLARNAGCDLYEVSTMGSDEEPIAGRDRLKALRAAQIFLSKRKSVLLFDEVEDVFNDGGFMGVSTAQARKGWLNRSLETNEVPTLWVTNNIQCMDPAFIRRFDISLEVDIPPPEKRKKIVARHCEQWIDAKGLAQLAGCEAAAPAIITRASKVVAAIVQTAPEMGSTSGESLLTLVENTLQAQGHSGLNLSSGNGLPDHYRTDFINCNTDLKQLAVGIKKQPQVRACLYGPPGTGKSAYAQWLAKVLGCPIHVKRSSDLIGMYVGETEKNIATAFDQAEGDGAILLIDEVDGFLQDRRQSRAVWETTAVNEMLTQMETFDGIFIATTNLMEGLDQASFRRFDLKLKFDYLQPAQSWKLLVQTCKGLGLNKPASNLKSRLQRLDRLTPGDFALLARQQRFSPAVSAQDLLHRLSDEQKLKTDAVPRKMGFI